jgi:hypothetical protein
MNAHIIIAIIVIITFYVFDQRREINFAAVGAELVEAGNKIPFGFLRESHERHRQQNIILIMWQ